MALSEQQFEVWSNTGADSGSAKTYEAIKSIIANSSFSKKSELNIFLQGSYANTTNVRANSDVDVVVMLENVWNSDKSKLTDYEKKVYSANTSSSNYGCNQLRNDLIKTFGNRVVKFGNKSITLSLGSGYLNADIIPCLSYRVYHSFSESNTKDYTEGIAIKKKDGTLIYNFPKQHIENGTKKHQLTNNFYKKIVRIFKNVRNRLVEGGKLGVDVAPSYFVECLLYNIPNRCYQTNLQTSFYNCLKWLDDNKDSIENLGCQNEITKLFGADETQWDITDCKTFISAIIKVWNEG